ncbi:MAG: hypothetical protein ACLFRG_11890 [Desulfococcaceae bacterium]
MKAIKTEAMVDPNREIHVKLPEEVRAASVEVVILFDEEAGGSPAQKTQSVRKFGQFRGKIRMSEDFDAPLPDEFWLGIDS